MKTITISTQFTIYNDINELPVAIQNISKHAVQIREKAYAPYSKFKVGAAVLLENGEIIVGANQENAAYPSGLCAERVAIFQAGSLCADVKIKALFLSAASELTTTSTPIPPCGACRQSIAEYELKQNEPIEIYFMGETGEIYKSSSIKDLLPLLFNKNLL
ncbi:cytidine deaminase [Flavobacterium sp. UMI-01]|uniref:cytidine deaminase n=1 Tax=Flavobacterium sp. UMI-01 TaxID=1441053 RepID=UPI001C7CE01D|nr:cytidine deaminase [Flavobacterium sp. UMI-01]GIZ08544.1 cytidine deaminase [Flavobacterium sp. UMI-01]